MSQIIRKGVKSIAKEGSTPLKDDVTLSEGTGVTITQSGQDIEIAASGGGSGDVTAAANITDNTIVRGDGGVKGVQDTGITINDSDSISGAVIDADNNTISNLEIGAEVTGNIYDLNDVNFGVPPPDDVLLKWVFATGEVQYGPDLSTLENTINGKISNVVEDTTPQLGGDLDGQAFDISTTGDVTADGVIGNVVYTDTMSEKTAAAGVTIDGVLVKDGGLTLATDLSVANGGTGVSTLASGEYLVGAGTGAVTTQSAATLKSNLSLTKSDVGLANVDNTSDANKPVSTAQQTALDAKFDRTDMRSIARLSKGSGGFDVTVTNAIQGVAFDGTHYYVTTKSHLYKYDTGGSLVTSRANSGDGNTHKYLGDLVVVGTKLYVASSNFDGSPGTFTAYAVEFNASDLTYVAEHLISPDERCDSVTYNGGYFWLPIYDKTIRQYDTSWNFVAEYDMPIGNWEVDPSANGIGFDGATWVGDYLVLNPHEGIYPDCAYVLYWNGTSFARIAQPDRPLFCTQGIDYSPTTGQIVAAERAATPRVTLMNIRTEIPARSDWKELRRTTLTSASDTITVENLPTRRYLKIMVSETPTGGTANCALRFNNDTGNNYARMRSVDYATGSASTSASSIGVSSTVTDTVMMTVDVLNVASWPKVVNAVASQSGTSGAGNAPVSIEAKGKWQNTSNAVSRIDIVNTAGTGDFAIGSEVIVYGRD